MSSISALSRTQQLFIHGVYRPSSDNAEFQVVNPMTGSSLYKCADATVQDVSSAIESAYTAFKTWSNLGPSARRTIFLKAADILEGYMSGDAPEILRAEVSATEAWVRVNIFATAGILRETAGLVTHIKGEVVPADRPGTTVLVTREALGVVFAISPWNAPVSFFPFQRAYILSFGPLPLTLRTLGKPHRAGHRLPPYLRQHSLTQALRAQPQIPRSCNKGPYRRWSPPRVRLFSPRESRTRARGRGVCSQASPRTPRQLHWQRTSWHNHRRMGCLLPEEVRSRARRQGACDCARRRGC